MRIAFQIGGAALAALLALPLAAGTEEENPWAPLPDAEGVEITAQNCAACHSARTFAHLNQSREWWDVAIDRMKADHGMWDLDAQVREEILDYLASYLGPESD